MSDILYLLEDGIISGFVLQSVPDSLSISRILYIKASSFRNNTRKDSKTLFDSVSKDVDCHHKANDEETERFAKICSLTIHIIT